MTPDFTLIWPLSCLKDGVHLCFPQNPVRDVAWLGKAEDPPGWLSNSHHNSHHENSPD